MTEKPKEVATTTNLPTTIKITAKKTETPTTVVQNVRAKTTESAKIQLKHQKPKVFQQQVIHKLLQLKLQPQQLLLLQVLFKPKNQPKPHYLLKQLYILPQQFLKLQFQKHQCTQNCNRSFNHNKSSSNYKNCSNKNRNSHHSCSKGKSKN